MQNVAKIPALFPTQPIDRAVTYVDRMAELMIQLEMEFSEQLDPDRLARAVRLSLDSEPVLGCRFVNHWRQPYWERLVSDSPDVFLAAHTELEYESFKLSPIDTYTGPQIRVCLWNSLVGARLLIKVSHCVADAAAVRDVARVISSIYSQLGHDPDYLPKPNLNGSRGIWQVLRAIPLRSYPGFFFQYLRAKRAGQELEVTLTLPFQEGPADALSFVNRLLPKDHVSRLVDYGRNLNATLNDLLLAAFFRALVTTANWDGHKHLRATTTVDLRRYVKDRKASAVTNLSMSVVGWPSLGTDLGHDFHSTVSKVSSITQRRKQKFVGVDVLVASLPLLCTLPHSWVARLVGRNDQLQIDKGNIAHFLTNLGPIDPDTLAFGSKPIMARLLPPPLYPPFFALGVSGYDGTLALSAGIYSSQRDVTERFLDEILAELSI